MYIIRYYTLEVVLICCTTFFWILQIRGFFNLYIKYFISLVYYCRNIYVYIIGRQHRKDIDLYPKPFRGNNNIINLYTSYEKNLQLSSNKYLLLLLLLYIDCIVK